MVATVGRRHLPRGWSDLGRQLLIWFGFAILYQLVRGLADQNPSRAFANGYHVVNIETHLTHRLYELTFQQFVDQRHLLETAVSWTYWNSEFTVVCVALLWVYLRRHEAFHGFRNSVLLANTIGLVGYFVMPTAPPRLLGVGFVNQHRDGLVTLLANPYAAMPSLHAGDALIVGVVLFSVCRNWWAKALWLAGLGLVRRDGDRQPLLARLRRRGPRRDRRNDGGLQRANPARACRSSGVNDRLATRSRTAAEALLRSAA
jgi:PAP2 superfamily